MAPTAPPVPPPRSRLARDLILPSSAPMPRLLYGTAWKKDDTAELVYQALKAGFRGIDTAAQPKHYREDLVAQGVRRAIAEGIVTRQDLFVCLTPSPSPPLFFLPDTPLANSPP